MKSRERILRAIEHEGPDRVPIDGAFRSEVWERLCTYFDVTDIEDVQKILGIDVRIVTPDPANGWIPPPSYKRILKIVMNNPVGLSPARWEEWGIIREPGATGHFYHITYSPLQNTDLEEYEFPDLDAGGRFERAEEMMKKWNQEYAVVGVGCGLFEHAAALRGWQRFITDLYMNPGFVDKLLDRLVKWKIELGKRWAEIGVDIVLGGGDVGMQTQMIIHPDLWRKYLKPREKKLINELKGKGLYFNYHTCGNVYPILPDLVEIGVDILNPIQPECMDPALIKNLYGDKLALRGSISLQETLPFGSIDDVKNEVIKRVRDLAPGGGFILSPANVVDDNVPLKNILTLYETAKKVGKYPIAA